MKQHAFFQYTASRLMQAGALLGLVVVASFAQALPGSLSAATRVLVQPDNAQRVVLGGNLRPEAAPLNDAGNVDPSLMLPHLQLLLRRSPQQQTELEHYLAEVSDKNSLEYHHWLTPEEFGERFGVAQTDIAKTVAWLQQQGFVVNTVYPNALVVDFSGTAAQVNNAFHANLRHLNINGKKHLANFSNPEIPVALAPVIQGVTSLHDFHPRPQHKIKKNYTYTDVSSNSYQAVTPEDLATIYNLKAAFSAGYTGQGQTIALIEDTDLYTTTDWDTFRSTFGLSAYTSGSLTQTHPAPASGPSNCSAPGANADDGEAILDAEYASAAAPDAAIMMASCADVGVTWGAFVALQNLINNPSPPAIISISYGGCEASFGAAANAQVLAMYQQAAAEGISVFVSSGDEGAAGCDAGLSNAVSGVAVNALASTPYNVAVGGTDFSDTYHNINATYWSVSNTANYGSALSYIPEIPWNDSCAGFLLTKYLGFTSSTGANGLCNNSNAISSGLQNIAAGSGGPSACASGVPSIAGVVSGTCAGYTKPVWQKILGNPGDKRRDLPDVSLFAADGIWGHYYVFCWSDTSQGGANCSGAPSTWSGAGGTSFASPILAGIQALVNQRKGSATGNPAPVYYSIARGEYTNLGVTACNSSLGNNAASACVFHDVTEGDMDVSCASKVNCPAYSAPSATHPAGLVGALKKGGPAFRAKKGWDFATGLGSVNAYNLVINPAW